MRMNKAKKNKLKKTFWRKIIPIVTALNIACASCFALAYGPYQGFQNWLITTALSTGTHQYFAEILYTEEKILEIASRNTVTEVQEKMDASAIKIGEIEIPETYESEYEKQVLERDADQLYKIVEINENGYTGYIAFVYDPTRISLVTPKYLGEWGQTLTEMADRAKAKLAINAGGWSQDKQKHQWPNGYIYQKGKVTWAYNRSSKWGGGTIGFTKEGVLMLTTSEDQDALNEGIYWGTDFGPFLIVNGKAAKFNGNGGYGRNPRTCIGQRKDGIVIMLVIDGRSSTSKGATVPQCIDIMQRYGAYNAANLDGGGSSAMYENGTLINVPKGYGYSGERHLTSCWVVK